MDEEDKPVNGNGAASLEVSLKEYFDRVFAEKDKKVEADRAALERGLQEAKQTTEKALQEAKTATKQELDNAKVAADERERVLQRRLDKLESGGAPFANRLDEGVSKLRSDVDTLNTDAVRTKVLDALRVQDATDAKNQKRQIRVALVVAGLGVVTQIVVFVANVVSSSSQP